VVPPATTVTLGLGSVVVEYAHDILKEGAPNAHFFQADVRQPRELLNRPEVQELLGGQRDVAFVFWGVAAFLSDEELAHAAQELYDWSGPKSCFVLQAQGAGIDTSIPAVAMVMKTYEQMGSALHSRSLERFQELVRPWHADATGWTSLLDWHGLSESEVGMTPEDRIIFGASGAGYGAYLIK
jgi:hypothetical protein